MTFRLALVQFAPERKHVLSNIRKIQTLLSGIKADLVVLPELANSGYLYSSPTELRPYAEPRHGSGEFLSALTAIAAETEGVIVTGYAEAQEGRLFNAAAAVCAQGVIANYRKIHLFADEKSLFFGGDEGFQVFEWKGFQIGMMICFDWIFPEAARTVALMGAQIIAHPANLVLPYCQDAMVTRSIENKVFTVTSNRIGSEQLNGMQLTFTGASQATNPKGEVLYRAAKNLEDVHVLSIDPGEALDKHISERNDLFADRQPGQYRLH